MVRFLRRTFSNKPTESVGAAALIISIAGLLSRLLGLLRDRVLASEFGAGDTLDVYYAAFRIPDLLFDFLVLGALSAAFIPVFTRLVSHDKEDESWKLSSGVLTLVVGAVVVFAGLFALFAPALVGLIVPGFSQEKQSLTVVFTQIMFFSPLFLAVSAVFGGILVSFKRFVAYAFAPVAYNIGIIVGVFFFFPKIGEVGLAWGVVFGAFLHMLIHLFAVMKTGIRFPLLGFVSLRDKNVRKVISLMIPRIFGTASHQIGLLVTTIFASTLAAGSLAIFTFANNIQSILLGLVGIPFAVAAFPTLTTLRAKKSDEEFVRIFSKTLRRILYIVVPLSAFLIILRAQIVRVLLGSGEFVWSDTIPTFQVMGMLALSLFAQCTVPLLARVFYAMENTKIPFFVALFSQGVNVALVSFFISSMGIMAIAVGFSVGVTLNMVGLLFLLRRRLHHLQGMKILHSILRIVLATLVAGTFAQFGKNILGADAEIDRFVEIAFQLLFSGSLGVGVYIFMSYVLKMEEFELLKNDILVKIFRKTAASGEDNHPVQ